VPEAGIKELTAAIMNRFAEAHFTTTGGKRGFVLPNGVDLRAVYALCTPTRPVIAEISFGRYNPRHPVSYDEGESTEGTLRLLRTLETLLEMFGKRHMFVALPEDMTTEQSVVYRTVLERCGWQSAGERDGRAVWTHNKGA
jgi:hypothetical protein